MHGIKIAAAFIVSILCFGGLAYIVAGSLGLEIYTGVALALSGTALLSWGITEIIT